MALASRWDVLALARRCALDSVFDYKQQLEDLKLSKIKKSYVFGLTLESEYIEMEGINFLLKSKKFYISVQACKVSQLLDFIKTNKVVYIEVYCSRTLCSKKWFNHWDWTALKFYPYCKKYNPVWGYYCYPEYDSLIKILPTSLTE